MVTDAQVRLLRRKLDEGKRQEGAAALAGMSVRSARRWQRGALPSQARAPRHWRTRKDPFAEVWESEVVPLLESDKDGELQATTILEVLEAARPGRFGPAHLRTLQRRLRDIAVDRGASCGHVARREEPSRALPRMDGCAAPVYHRQRSEGSTLPSANRAAEATRGRPGALSRQTARSGSASGRKATN